MCSGCERVWSILHVLWSALYVTSGAAQLVAGIFFLLALPSFLLACNLLTGLWNIFMGIGVGMVACCGQISPRRQETLLYMVVSILTFNTVNVILSEWGYYIMDLPKLLQQHQYHTLLQYASFATRIATAAVIAVSFLDSQLAFCSMQTTATNPANAKKLRGSHEQVSDIEYIIPRAKSAKPQVCNAYSQSWVFDAENGGVNKTVESPYLKLPQDGTPKRSPAKKKSGEPENDTTYLIDNPMVHIEEASDDSNSNSDRKLCYMKSFSRSASPCVLSASSSQISLNQHNHQAGIYECLEKLTQPDTFRSRLHSSLSNREEPQYQAPQVMGIRRADSTSPQVEQVQYASLMKELQSAIVNKKDPSITSPPSNSESATRTQSSSRQGSSKNSDAEFSKELEAALQLIQDLESPNTIETPSESKEKDSKPLAVWRNSRSDSEKTLSAVGSLAEIASPLNECQQPELYTFKPAQNGKPKAPRAIVQHSDSQSTSGYSSPTHNHQKGWSTTSSLNGSHNELAYTIHNTKSAAVISLYDPDTLKSKTGKSVTLVNITGNQTASPSINNNNNVTITNQNTALADNRNAGGKSVDVPSCPAVVTSSHGWKSLLRGNKKPKPKAKLCAELEGAIVKSESLAYLTELELLARHQRNNDIYRQIEQRVQQQLGTPWTDSE